MGMPSTGETGRDRRLLLVWLRLGGGKADLGVGEAQAQLTGTQASFCCSWCRNRHCCSGQRRSDSWEPPGHRSNCREECRGWAGLVEGVQDPGKGRGGAGRGWEGGLGEWGVGGGWDRLGVGPTHLQVTSPLCLLTTQAPSRQRLHLFTSHLGPSK